MVMSLVLMVRAKKGISLSTPLFELPYPYQDFHAEQHQQEVMRTMIK